MRPDYVQPGTAQTRLRLGVDPVYPRACPLLSIGLQPRLQGLPSEGPQAPGPVWEAHPAAWTPFLPAGWELANSSLAMGFLTHWSCTGSKSLKIALVSPDSGGLGGSSCCGERRDLPLHQGQKGPFL